MTERLERIGSLARALQAIGVALMLLAFVAACWRINELADRVDVLATRITALDTLPADPLAPTLRARVDAGQRAADAMGKCRHMGQVPIGGEVGSHVVCLQAPSVAFEIDPEWP